MGLMDWLFCDTDGCKNEIVGDGRLCPEHTVDPKVGKPWEENWWADGEVVCEGTTESDCGMIADFHEPIRAKLAAQAPALVRELLSALVESGNLEDCNEHICGGCWHETARQVLRKAGVVPSVELVELNAKMLRGG